MAIKNIQNLTQISSISSVDQVQDGIVFYDQSATGDEKTKTLTLPALIDLIESIPAAAWIRPSDWLTLPTIETSDQKLVGLLAIFDSGTEYSNVCELSCSGAYTVDWGDGVTENFASGATATHTYTYSSISSSTLSSRGYRQAVVTVTPQSGQSLTSVNLHLNSTGLSLLTQWLEIACGSSSLSSLTIGSATELVRFSLLENIILKQNNISSFSNCFRRCTALQHYELNTVNGTTFTNIFSSCHSLKHAPFFNTSNGTSLLGAFSSCFSLESIALLDLSSATNLSSLFSGCSNLKTIPQFNTSSAVNIGSMFQNCSSLTTIPLINTSASTSFQAFFQACTNLKTIPAIDTSNGANFANFLQSCSNLQSIPVINTANATNFTSFMQTSNTIQTIPAINMSNGTGLSNAFVSASNISLILATGIKVSFSVASLKLGQAALVTLFNNLATVTGQTITITGNPGASLLTTGERAIATGKGWTITG